MKSMDEFNLINIVNKLIEFDLITQNQRHKIIDKNRQRLSKTQNQKDSASAEVVELPLSDSAKSDDEYIKREAEANNDFEEKRKQASSKVCPCDDGEHSDCAICLGHSTLQEGCYCKKGKPSDN